MSPVIYAAAAPTNVRPDHDVYVTPQPLADAAVAYLTRNWVFQPPETPRVLDTGAGMGAWGDAWRHIWDGGHLVGVEVRNLPMAPGYSEWHCQDYLDFESPESPALGSAHGFNAVIGNPPFSLAESFIRKSLSLLAPDGLLAYLLPSAFQHGQARGRGLFAEHPPADVVSLLQRPNFEGMGSSNVNDYILIVWSLSYSGPPRHSWLDWKPQLSACSP